MLQVTYMPTHTLTSASLSIYIQIMQERNIEKNIYIYNREVRPVVKRELATTGNPLKNGLKKATFFEKPDPPHNLVAFVEMCGNPRIRIVPLW